MKPSIGRVVLVYPDGHSRDAQPLAGLVCYVHSDSLINVCAHDQEGRPMPLNSVKLVEPDGEMPNSGHCACWMPYQIEQAKKNDAETAKILEAGKTALAEQVTKTNPPAQSSTF